jgi:hypothetical protein
MLISSSRKGYWRLAMTPQLNKALGLAYWRNQGLFSLAEEIGFFLPELRESQEYPFSMLC